MAGEEGVPGSGSQSPVERRKDNAVFIIGWDAAVDPRNTALALVRWAGGGTEEPGELQVVAHVAPRDHEELIATVSDWADRDAPTLLCVDSPLGWPQPMAGILSDHVAGFGLPISADALFRRKTDIDVRQRVGKTPLDVGADRIARTALATLNAIASLRDRMTRSIEMPTDICHPRDNQDRILLLESYPAGWFASEGIVTRGYRPAPGGERRRILLTQVEQHLNSAGIAMNYASNVDRDVLTHRADDLDALVCTLNGVDYLRGRCPAPEATYRETARREGWIWCKDRDRSIGTIGRIET